MFWSKKSHFKVSSMVLVCAMLMQLSSGLFVSAMAMPFYDTGSTGSVVDTGNGDSGNIDDEMSTRDSGVVLSLRAGEPQPMPAGFITNVEVGQKLEGSTVLPFDEKKPVARDASFGIKYTYTIPPKDSGEIYPNIGYWFEIPDHMALPNGKEINFKISESGVGEIARGIVSDGRVTITFNELALTKELLKPGVDGSFWFDMSFNKSVIENNGDKEFTDWGNGTNSPVTVPFKVDQVTAEVDMAKTTTGADITSTDNNLYTIPWVITLTPKMENIKTGDNKFSKWVVTDKIPAHLEYVDNANTSTIVDKGDKPVTGATITYEESTKTLTCTFPDNFDIGTDSVFKLSFRTKFNPAIVADSGIATDGKYTFKNTATTEYTYPQYKKDTDEGDTKGQAIKIADETGTKDAKAETEITGGSFDKKGVLTAMKPEAKIKWTIDVTNAVNLENPTIKDKLPEKAKLVPNSLKVKIGENESPITQANGGNTIANTYKLSESGKELTIYLAGGTAAQTITYETTLSGLVAADVNIINNAQFLGGPGPNLGLIFEKSATVPLNDQLMTKGGTYNPADHTIDWTIQVSGAGSSLKNVVLTDKITEGQEFVADSLKAVPDAQSAEYNTDTKTITVIYDENPSTEGKEKVTYKTKLTDDQKHLWGNNVTSGDDKKAYNDVTLTATDMISLTVTGNAPITSEVLRKEYKGYDFATHKAKWQVTVNQNQMAITNPVVIDEITTAGCAFVEDEITVMQNGADVTATKLNKKDFANNTTTNEQRVNPKMTLTLVNMQQSDKPYVITYYTVLAEDKLQTNAKVPIENKVILKGNEIYDKLNPIKVKAEVGSNVLDKTGTNTKDGYIRWDVIINENLVPITASDGAELKLIDKLEEGLALDLSSVVMKTLEYKSTTDNNGEVKGEWAEGAKLTPKTDYTINYNNKTRVFEIIFPTNKITTAYKLSFRTDVITGTKHSNTISFNSITGSNPGGSETEIDLSTGGGITETKRGHIEITKKDSDGITLLTGAEFTLSKDDRDIAVMAVDENGVLEFKDVRVGTYYLTETKAPYGYLLPNAPNNRTEIVVKDKETTIKTITNTRITNDLTITKTDDKTNATALNGAEFTVMRTGGGENDNITFADVIITSGKTTTLKTVAGTGTNGAAVGKFITTVVGEPASGTKGEAKITGLPVGTYTVTEKTAPNGYVLDAKTETFTVASAGAAHAKVFTNKQILGSLKLTKTDGKTPATLLADAEFTVKRVGEIDDNITFDDANIKTGTNGEVILTDLPVGTYTVTETKAPSGYVLNSAPKNFEIVGNGTARAEQKTLTVTNEKIEGTILVTKTDAADPAKKLQGAEFTATKTDAPNKDDKFSAITDANGVATFKLAAGNYTVVETKAPSGYVLNGDKKTVTIVDMVTAQPAQVTLGFTNTQILGSLELTKTDELGKLLAGAEFSVTRAGTPAFTATITTDVNGKTTLASLPVGTYTVTETKAPNGYVLDAEPQIFTIDDNGTQQTAPKQLTFKNTWAKGKLQISKTDTATDAALAGAEFTIVKVGGGYSQNATTGADGKAEVTMLMRGNYEVTEVKAPKGYQIDTTKQTIAVSDTAIEVTLSFTNTLILGSLELTKTDDKTPAKPLEGAKFELYNTEGDALVAEGTTDKDGKLRFDNLTAGNYYYKEKQAPVGYVKDETKRAFSITVNGQVVAETFTNKAVPPSNNGGGNNTPSVSPPPEVVIVPPPTVPQSPLPGTPPNTTPQISSGTIPTTPTGTPEVKVQPANGTVIIDKDGKWVYTPKAGFVGDDEFTATVTYPSGYTETFVIKLSVLSGYVPFLPETGEAPRTMFYVGGLLLIMLGVIIKRKLKKI